LVLSIALLACKGDKQAADRPVRPVDGLTAVPARVSVVIAADVGRLSKSQLVRRAVGEMLARDVDLQKRVAELLAGCKLVPGKDIDGVVVAMGDTRERSLLVAQGSFDEAVLASCVGKSMSASGGELTRGDDQGRTIYTAVGSTGLAPVFFALGSSHTLVVSSSKEMLGEALGDGEKLAANRRMGELLERVDTNAPLWAVGLVPDGVGAGLVGKAGLKKPPQAMVVRAAFDDGIEVRLDVEMGDQSDAKSALSLAKPQLAAASLVAQKAGLGALVNRITVDADGPWLVLGLKMGASEVGEILARVQRVVDRSPPPQQNPPSNAPPSDGDEEERHG